MGEIVGALILMVFLTGCTGNDSSGGKHTDIIEFTGVTQQAGLYNFKHQTGAFGKKWFPETMGSGCGFLDYNGDGDLDILLIGGGAWPDYSDQSIGRTLWLYKNNGDGTFSLVTEEAGLNTVEVYGMGFAAADYDNDGDTDLFLTTLEENRLLRNDGGVFTDVTERVGLGDHSSWSTAAVFFDANRDGHLDLYVGNYVNWSPENDIYCSQEGQGKVYCTPEVYDGVGPRFYVNNGDGTFTERTEDVGIRPAPGKALGAVTLDYNNDGWPDLAVANDLERNLLYRNEGDGTFKEVGMLSGVALNQHGKARGGMGIDVGNVSNTGKPTIFVGNFSNEMAAVFQYDGEGRFLDHAARSQIGSATVSTLTFGLFLMDVDYDTDQDLFVANGHIRKNVGEQHYGVTYRQPVQIFLNNGQGTFSEYSPSPGSVLETPLVARGAAYGDYDNDGDPDVLITENGGSAHLWRNDIDERNFLRVRLDGTDSNSDGIGSEVQVVVGDTVMTRRVRTGSSYLSQSELAVTFGLEDVSRVDTLRVYWPSGTQDEYVGIDANQEVKVVEGREDIAPIALNPTPSAASQ